MSLVLTTNAFASLQKGSFLPACIWAEFPPTECLKFAVFLLKAQTGIGYNLQFENISSPSVVATTTDKEVVLQVIPDKIVWRILINAPRFPDKKGLTVTVVVTGT